MNLDNAGKNWTPEHYKDLREAFGDGDSLEALQDLLGRSAGAVVSKLVELRLLVQDRNGFYYRVNPDPWCSHHDVRYIDKGGSEA
jgi:hypothetical protein